MTREVERRAEREDPLAAPGDVARITGRREDRDRVLDPDNGSDFRDLMAGCVERM